MKIDKFYNEAYDWVISYGPRFIIGMLTFFVGMWLIRLVLNWSHRGMHRKEMALHLNLLQPEERGPEK